MNYDKKNNSYIVRTSINKLYHFFLVDKNLVVMIFENGTNIDNFIIKHEIDEFSLDIDKNDLIHIAYLSKNKLKYFTYPTTTAQDTIILSTCGSSIIKELSIKIINFFVHVFYIQDKVELNLSFIFHSYLYDNHWHHIQVDDLISPKYINSYHFEYCSNDLYLLYSKHKFQIKKFSISSNMWTDFDSNISIDNISNLHFLITSDNIGILCFNQFIDKNLQAIIKYKSFNASNTSWSSNINVSMTSLNSARPKAFFKDNTVHVIWTQGDTIIHKKSQDLLSWENENNIYIKSQKHVSTYISNNNEDKDYKMNTIDTNFIFSQLNLINYNTYDSKEYAANDMVLTMTHTNNDTNIINCNRLIQDLLNEVEKKDKEKEQLLKVLQEEKIKYSKQLATLHESIEQYKIELDKLRNERMAENKDLLNIILQYEREFKNLKSENENLLLSVNNKIQCLLEIIEEKNSIIRKLHF
jgi:hypothetical protein